MTNHAHSVFFSVHLWNTLSQWFDSLGQGQYTAVALNAQEVVLAVGPVINAYLSRSEDTNTRIQMLRSTIDLFGHDDWAACARKTAVDLKQSADLAVFKELSKNTKKSENRQIFVAVAVKAAQAAVDSAEQTLQQMAEWGAAPAKLKI